MPFPAYGVPGYAFVASRSLQLITLTTIIGLAAHCIAEMEEFSIKPFPAVIGLLSISCFGLIHAAFTSFLYMRSSLPHHISFLCDGFLFISYLLLTILFGNPVATFTCHSHPHDYLPSDVKSSPDEYTPHPERLGSASNLLPFVNKLLKRNHDYDYYSQYSPFNQENRDGSWMDMPILDWLNGNLGECMMMKALWGLGLAVMVLFLISTGCSVAIWNVLRKQQKQERTMEGKLEAGEPPAYS